MAEICLFKRYISAFTNCGLVLKKWKPLLVDNSFVVVQPPDIIKTLLSSLYLNLECIIYISMLLLFSLKVLSAKSFYFSHYRLVEMFDIDRQRGEHLLNELGELNDHDHITWDR